MKFPTDIITGIIKEYPDLTVGFKFSVHEEIPGGVDIPLGVEIAKYFGMTDAVIGLTVVAVGTSLPELITSAVAAIKNKADIAIGNAVGSSIFNILFILGFTAVLLPISAQGISFIDLGFMMITAAILLPLSIGGLRINRVEALLLLIGYFLYMYFLFP